MITMYTTIVNGDVSYSGPSLEYAIRTWDANSKGQYGMIDVVVTKQDGTRVRHGNILHVDHNGVYVNPRIAE